MKKKNIKYDIKIYDFSDKLEIMKKFVEDSNNVTDDKIYANMEKTLLKFSNNLNQYYFKINSMYFFLEQYADLTSKLLIKYSKNQCKNIYDVNEFINFYVNDSIRYQEKIISEICKFGLIEEQYTYTKYFGNLFTKIMQVLSVIYRKDNMSDSKTVYEKSKINKINEKAKIIVDYVISLNKRSLKINQCNLFKPTNTLLEILVSLPNIIVDNEEDFKRIIEDLYKVFWDNNQKIREYNSNDELNFVNWLRTFYCHDIEHGDSSGVVKKHKRVKDLFKEACGKCIPENAKDWQKVQEHVYDRLIDFLKHVEIVEFVSI